MLMFWGEKFTVSDIHYDIVLWMYDLWDLQFYMAGTIYPPGSTCGDHDVIYFGLLWITTLFPSGDSCVQLQ